MTSPGFTEREKSWITGADAPDPTTLIIHYQTAIANGLSQLQQLAILPQHVWSRYATGDGGQLKSFKNQAPIVSGGPYKLVEFKKDDIALFQKNPLFYGPKPHLDGFGLRMFSNDDAMIQAAKHGEIDAIEGGGGTIPPPSVKTLKGAAWGLSEWPGDANTAGIASGKE